MMLYSMNFSTKQRDDNDMYKVTQLKRCLTLLPMIVAPISFTADAGQLLAQQQEVSAVTNANASYYSAFKQSNEDNWVYQLAQKNELKQHCYLSKDKSLPLGKQISYQGVEMTCIQIGKSSRIFWPTRWVEHCQSVGKPYNICMIDDIKT